MPLGHGSASTSIGIDNTLPARRLGRIIRDLLEAHPHYEYLGPDRSIEDLVASFGLSTADLSITRAILGRRLVTVIAIASRAWRSPSTRLSLFRLREAAAFMDIRLLIVPESSARKRPRRDNARVVADAAGVRVSADDRMLVLRHLAENGDMALGDLATIIESATPFATILSMASNGAVDIDLDQRITPATIVRIPIARAA